MKIVRKDLDAVIRINKKYYKSGDSDFLEALLKAENKCRGNDTWIDDIITGITFKKKDKDEPYETYYKVLEVLGCEIVDE